MKSCRPLAAILLMPLALVWADPPAPPSVDQLMDSHIEASGGRQAHEKIQNSVTHGTIEIKAQGLSGTIVSTTAAPCQLLSEITFEGLGMVKEGISGEVVWESSLIQGSRILTGAERTMRLRQARSDLLLNWRKYYKQARVEPSEPVSERAAWRVVFIPESGKPESIFIDRETFQLLGSEMTIESPLGEISTRATFHDFQTVGGVTVPGRIVQEMLGLSTEIRFTQIEHNIDLPEGFFDLPEEIQALMETAGK